MHVDPTRRSGWVPPHCPNRNCPHHLDLPAGQPPWAYLRKGFYLRTSDQIRVQRFQCRTCRVTFSTQTFSTSYWQRRPELPCQLFMLSVGCMAVRQIARTLCASPQTICEHISRLARHLMLWQSSRLTRVRPKGPIVIDGLRSFEFSQFHPIEHHVAVERETSFVLYHTDSELRRSGRMTPRQKLKRARLEQTLGRPDPQSTKKDVHELLRVSLEGLEQVVLHSDEHQSYPRAIRGLNLSVDHRVTHSKVRRTRVNPLFEVNLFDLWIRHGQGNHKRETIAASKRRQSSAERLVIFQFWKNYVQKRRVNGPLETPAMLKGVASLPLNIQDVYRVRSFPGRIDLPPRWQEYYRRKVRTREYEHNQVHDLKYAF